MDLIYTFVIPIVIIIISYFVNRPKNKTGNEYITLGLKTLPYEWGYLFLLCYLALGKQIDIGYVPIGIEIWLLPVTGILIVIKVVLLVKGYFRKNKHKKG